MERSAIKSFAIWARRHLQEQVTARLKLYGITAATLMEPQLVAGGLIVLGETLDAVEAAQYGQLREHLKDLMGGCAIGSKLYGEAIVALIDEIAYTWFNRLAALRYMEVNGYLGQRVLSNEDAALVDPEILRSASEIAVMGELPGLTRETLEGWRSAGSRMGNPDEFVYRKLLGVQCVALSGVLPFLFDRNLDFTGMFLPGNLLNRDSIIRRFVADIPEEDWRDAADSENGVEIIGWLYQFYISERKDEVIGAKSKIAARDIPAATQLFTPHWIVRYMVENSLGRLWLESHPESGLRSVMKYYLEDPHPPAPSPRAGEGEHDRIGERERWEVPETVRQKMKEVAREFRKLPTESEAIVWQALRGSKLAGRKFRRQQPIGTFVVDFFCAAERLIVEVDGAVHDLPEQQSLDAQRQMLLESLGLKFVRVSNPQVKSNLPAVLKTIESSFQELTQVRPPLAPAWERGPGGEGASLQPQDLTVMDPACGSGHILVYAFDLLFEIYKEQGYRDREIPGLILTHNLHGLDIDARAVQLASFAVLMKARAKNSRLFRDGMPTLNIVMVKSTKALLTSQLTIVIGGERPVEDWKKPPEQLSLLPGTKQLGWADIAAVKGEDAGIFSMKGLVRSDWQPLLEAFAEAENLGSLITPPGFDGEKLLGQVAEFERENSLFGAGEAAEALREVVRQAGLLRRQYWVVVANPPYMGSKGMNAVVKDFAQKHYPDSKSDLFAVAVDRILEMTSKQGRIGLMTPFTWMFLSSYEKLRKNLLNNTTITSLIRPEYHAFFESAFVPICTFTLKKEALPEYKGTFIDLSAFYGADLQPVKTLEAIDNPNCGYLYHAKAADFGKIPGSPIAFWMSNNVIDVFVKSLPITDLAKLKVGLQTGDNDRFMKLWFEVSFENISFGVDVNNSSVNDRKQWFPFNKGGDFQKWHGNQEYVVNWFQDGKEIRNCKSARPQNVEFYFRECVSWSKVTAGGFSLRYFPKGFIFADAGCSIFPTSNDQTKLILGILNSTLSRPLLSDIAPTMNYEVGQVSNVPILKEWKKHTEKACDLSDKCIEISKLSCDDFETSWDFKTHPLSRDKTIYQLSQAFTTWQTQSDRAFQQLKQLEEENNRYWIEAYGLQSELTPEVPDDQITIRRADLDRDIRSFISYAVGCMMGRYSLDTPGLIHAGQPFDPTRHTTFPADQDAILPITDQAYFDDDIVTRFITFVATAYPQAHLTENLDFIATALTLKSGETARDRIRRYFLTEFITDHIKTYKKRPIYWLFTSGKKRAFSALVYLHRYSPDTVGRLRTDYVLELQVKLDQEIDRLKTELNTSTSTPTKKAATKQLKTLQEQQLELRDYQAKLQTVADRRIAIELDDGVAYNYTRFKGLVYEGTDLKMADLEAKAQWKLDLLKQQTQS